MNGNRTLTGYVTGASNLLLSDGVFTYSYDAEGNQVERKRLDNTDVWTFGYDHNNQWLFAEHKPTTSGSVDYRIDFKYDVFGNRIERAEDPDGIGSAGTTVTRFTFDGMNAWADLDGSSSLTTRRIFADTLDQPLAKLTGTTVVYPMQDRLGSVREIADNTTGALIYQVTFGAYGNIESEVNPSNRDRHLYAGYQFEPGPTLYYVHLRPYDPATGRFLGEDAIPNAPNAFEYVGNGPTNGTDPTGMEQFVLGLREAQNAAGWLANFGITVTPEWVDRQTLELPSGVGGLNNTPYRLRVVGGIVPRSDLYAIPPEQQHRAADYRLVQSIFEAATRRENNRVLFRRGETYFNVGIAAPRETAPAPAVSVENLPLLEEPPTANRPRGQNILVIGETRIQIGVSYGRASCPLVDRDLGEAWGGENPVTADDLIRLLRDYVGPAITNREDLRQLLLADALRQGRIHREVTVNTPARMEGHRSQPGRYQELTGAPIMIPISELQWQQIVGSAIQRELQRELAREGYVNRLTVFMTQDVYEAAFVVSLLPAPYVGWAATLTVGGIDLAYNGDPLNLASAVLVRTALNRARAATATTTGGGTLAEVQQAIRAGGAAEGSGFSIGPVGGTRQGGSAFSIGPNRVELNQRGGTWISPQTREELYDAGQAYTAMLRGFRAEGGILDVKLSRLTYGVRGSVVRGRYLVGTDVPPTIEIRMGGNFGTRMEELLHHFQTQELLGRGYNLSQIRGRRHFIENQARQILEAYGFQRVP